ncbi:MAG: hypothetical protein KBT29_04450 [Prevotellaceae bacterium]|nr:hypothetical protein [Candidatus Minthosoma caballi]
MDKIISNILNKSGYEDLKPLCINGKKSGYYAYVAWQNHCCTICFCDENLNTKQRTDIGIPEGIFYIAVSDDYYCYGDTTLSNGLLVNSDGQFVRTCIPEDYEEKAFLISPLIKEDCHCTETPFYYTLGKQYYSIEGQYCLYSFSLRNCHFFIGKLNPEWCRFTNNKKDSPVEYKLIVVDDNGKVLFSQQSSFVFVWCCSDGSYYIVSYEKDEYAMFLRLSVTDNSLRTMGYGKPCNSTRVYIYKHIGGYQDAFRPKLGFLYNNYCDCTETRLLICGQHFFSIVERNRTNDNFERILSSEAWEKQFDWLEFFRYKYSNDILRVKVDANEISYSDMKKRDDDFMKEWRKGGAYLLCDMKGFIFAEQKYGGITYIPYNHSLPKKCGVLTEEHNIMIPFLYDEIIGLDLFTVENDTKKEYKRLYIALTGTKSNDNLYDSVTIYLNEKELISLVSCEYNIFDNKYVQLTSYNEQNNPYNVLYYYKGQLIDDEYSHVENGDKLFIENPRLIEKLSDSFDIMFNNSNPNILEIRHYFSVVFPPRNIYRKSAPSLCCWNSNELWILAGNCYNYDKYIQEIDIKRRLEELTHLASEGE